MNEVSSDIGHIHRDDRLLDMAAAYFRAYRDLYAACAAVLSADTELPPSQYAEDDAVAVNRHAYSQLVERFAASPPPPALPPVSDCKSPRPR